MKRTYVIISLIFLTLSAAYAANEWHQPSNAIFHGTVKETGLNTAGIMTNTSAGLFGTVNPVPVANGGSGAQTFTTNGVIYGNGTSALGATAAGTQYQIFQAGASGVPTIGALHLDQSAAITGVLPNASTTATNANTASAIVARDGSGNFSAGTITANLTGNVTGTVTGSASLNVLKAGDTMTGALQVPTVNLTTKLQVNSSDFLVVSGSTTTENLWFGQGASSALTTGTGNLLISSGAANNTLTSALRDTLIGNAVLPAITSGTDNVAIGTNIAPTATTLAQNTFVGNSIATTNGGGKGERNVGVGYASLGNIGGASSTTGAHNVAIGYNTCSGVSSGAGNTCVGYQADTSTTTGTNNTTVGINAGPSGNFSNATAIGANAAVGASNDVVIGNGVNVGIDSAFSSTPTARLSLPGGTATASSAPLKIHSGTLLTSAEAGAIENDGTSLYYTNDLSARIALGSGGGGGLNFVGLSTSFTTGTADDVNAENSTGNWATYADAAGTDPVDMTGGSATALTFSRTSTAGEVLDGSGSFKIVKAASNAQGMGVSDVVNIPPGYRGQNMQYTIPFHIISGSIAAGDLKFEAYDVTNSALLSASCNTGSSSVANQVYTTGTVLIICNGVIPSTTAQIRIGFHFASTSTTAVTFSFDDVYVAPPSNVGSVNIAADWANDLTFTPNNFGTLGASDFRYKRVGDTMFVRAVFTPGTVAGSVGSITLPLAMDSAKLSSSAAGSIVGVGNGTTSATTGVGFNNQTFFLFYDGSDTTKVYVSLQAGSGALIKNNANNVAASSQPVALNFSIPIASWASSGAAFNASQSGAVWSGYTNGISGGCATTSTTFADPSSCTNIALTQLQNFNFGTVTTAGSSLPGITFTPSKAGVYRVCANVNLTDSATSTPSMKLVDSNGNDVNKGQSMTISAGSGFASFDLCGMVNAPSGAALTVKAQFATNTGTASITQGQASGTPAINWDIFPANQNVPAPLLVNSVTSSSAGVERVERAKITNGGSCAIASQSGSWVSSVSHPGTGQCTLTLASGEFSSSPTCTCSWSGGSGARICSVSVASSTSLTVETDSVAPAGADADFFIICQGPH